MKLQDQLILINELLILRSSMAALTSKKRLVPAATGLNVANGNEWLRVHRLRFKSGVALAVLIEVTQVRGVEHDR